MILKEKEDVKNKRKGIAISIAVHALLLLLFFFVIAWRMPNPPPPGLPGMEINLGFVEAGSGDEQTSIEDVSEELPIEEVLPEDPNQLLSDEDLVKSPLESPYSIKESTEKKEANKENKEPAKEKKQVANPDNTYKSTSKSDGDKDKKGDQGKTDGNPDSRNMYDGGKGTKKGAGSGDGGLLNLPGWAFDFIPKDPDLSTESGYVIFQFRIDENGKVEMVKKIGEGNLSPTTIDFYKKKLLLSTFKPKNANFEPENGETGTLRIDVKAK